MKPETKEEKAIRNLKEQIKVLELDSRGQDALIQVLISAGIITNSQIVAARELVLLNQL